MNRAIVLEVTLTILLTIVFLPVSNTFGQPQQESEPVFTFHLQGNHAEDTVSQTAEILGWNTTVFEPLSNGSILVKVKPIYG